MCVCMYVPTDTHHRITLLYTWNIVNQLYPSKRKEIQTLRPHSVYFLRVGLRNWYITDSQGNSSACQSWGTALASHTCTSHEDQLKYIFLFSGSEWSLRFYLLSSSKVKQTLSVHTPVPGSWCWTTFFTKGQTVDSLGFATIQFCVATRKVP